MFVRLSVLLAFCLFTTEAAYLIKSGQQTEPRDTTIKPSSMWDDTEKKIEEVRTVVSDAITKAFGDLLQIHKNLQQNGYVIQLQGKQLIENAKKDTDDELENIKSLANSVNKNISICLTENQNEEKLNGLPQKITNEVVDCVYLSLCDADTAVSNYRERINLFYGRLSDLSRLFKECSSDGLTCLAKIIELADMEGKHIPEEIPNIVVDAYRDQDIMISNIGLCPDLKIAEYKNKAKKILDEIEDCVNNI